MKEEKSMYDFVYEPDDQFCLSDEWTSGEEIAARPLGELQFRLSGLFGLLTVAAIYFALERAHQGQFALHAALGTLVFVVVLLPACWVAAWLARAVADRGALGLVMLALAVGGGVMAGLFGMARF
jgi:hypothetical protein